LIIKNEINSLSYPNFALMKGKLADDGLKADPEVASKNMSILELRRLTLIPKGRLKRRKWDRYGESRDGRAPEAK
jgi:hypothetical protein